MKTRSLPIILCFLVLNLIWNGCERVREETVAGVAVPIPPGMKKLEKQGVELALPGFGSESASFEGSMDPKKIIDFYQKEMPERGWKPNVGIVSRGGMLAFSKEGQTVLIGVGKSNGSTNLSITVGTTRP